MEKALNWRQLGAVVAGNALEFYDFLVFSFFAIQIGQAFFPSHSSTASLLQTLAVFGAGFLTRPLGGLVLGTLGDRLGRKPTMLFSFGLMGLSIAGLALTPPFSRIGVGAPVLVLLFRLTQGFALGGEVGPTTAFLMEAAPATQRGLYVSLQSATQYFAVLCAGLVGLLLVRVMPPALFSAWGWRIAMLLGVAVVPFAFMMRRRLPETLHAQVSPRPRLSRAQLRLSLLGLCMFASNTVSTYTVNYLTTYATHTLGFTSRTAFGATVAAGCCATLGALLGGWGSDQLGRKPVMLAGAGLLLLAAVPAFLAMYLWRTPPVLIAASSLLAMLVGLYPPAILVSFSESMPAALRAGSLGTLYALAIASFGGSAQYVVTWLIFVTGSPLAPAWYMTAALVPGICAMLVLRETAPVKTGA